MNQRVPVVAFVLIAVSALPIHAVQAQLPKTPEPAFHRPRGVSPRADTSKAIRLRVPTQRLEALPQEPVTREGINVGWTVLGAVLGYVAYQSAAADVQDGDFAAPFSVALFIGVGAALGTLVGMILE